MKTSTSLVIIVGFGSLICALAMLNGEPVPVAPPTPINLDAGSAPTPAVAVSQEAEADPIIFHFSYPEDTYTLPAYDEQTLQFSSNELNEAKKRQAANFLVQRWDKARKKHSDQHLSLELQVKHLEQRDTWDAVYSFYPLEGEGEEALREQLMNFILEPPRPYSEVILLATPKDPE